VRAAPADGRTRSFSYDSGGRQTAENWLNSQGQSIYAISYTYDSDGHLTAVSDPDAAYAYTYNAAGQALTWNDSGTPGLPSLPMTFGYDYYGNRNSLTDGLGLGKDWIGLLHGSTQLS
jgi:YD repeat-containing protein